MIPLQGDGPLVLLGVDGVANSGDEVAAGTPMILPRAVAFPGMQQINLTTPIVDQNQTYGSNASQQVFLREYELNEAGDPVPTGRLLENEGDPAVEGDEGMATWKDIKDQARTLLGIELGDTDILNVPELVTDPYGHFVPGPNGMPQLVTDGGAVGGDLTAPVSPLTAVAHRTGHAFLDDIAHHAVPMSDDPDGPRGPALPTTFTPDSDAVANGAGDPREEGTYDNEMLEAHFIVGDGRVNENIGLTAIHHVFRSEHNRLTAGISDMLTDTDDPAFINQWTALNEATGWG